MIERKIIIGLITSTEYCQRIKDIWNIQLLESATAKRIASWVWNYFDEYKTAPKREIETIFYSHLKDLQKDIAEEIEQEILPGLSQEYENEDFNLAWLLKESRNHLNDRHVLLFNENVQALLTSGKREEAEKLIRDFKPLNDVSILNDYILTINQIRRKDRPRPITLMRPWLKEGQGTIIYGGYGTGKSLIALHIAYVVGLQNFNARACEIGSWQVKNPTGCLYIDGEIGEQEMDERIQQFEWLGKQNPEHRIRILSLPEYQLETEDTFSLSKRENQQKIVKWLSEHQNYRLIVLDSITTLFGLENENDNSEWNNKLTPFLRELRSLGIAWILLHHSGKGNKKGLRGASAMGALPHNIFCLVNHNNRVDGEAWFVLSKDKQRAAGITFRDFAIRYSQDPDQAETHWEITKTEGF